MLPSTSFVPLFTRKNVPISGYFRHSSAGAEKILGRVELLEVGVQRCRVLNDAMNLAGRDAVLAGRLQHRAGLQVCQHAVLETGGGLHLRLSGPRQLDPSHAVFDTANPKRFDAQEHLLLAPVQIANVKPDVVMTSLRLDAAGRAGQRGAGLTLHVNVVIQGGGIRRTSSTSRRVMASAYSCDVDTAFLPRLVCAIRHVHVACRVDTVTNGGFSEEC